SVLYNCRVAQWHTYFVGCDEWGFAVWAHNAYDGPLDPVELTRAARRRDGADMAAQLPARRSIIESVFGKVADACQEAFGTGSSPRGVNPALPGPVRSVV